jgi:hypothetical protein
MSILSPRPDPGYGSGSGIWIRIRSLQNFGSGSDRIQIRNTALNYDCSVTVLIQMDSDIEA